MYKFAVKMEHVLNYAGFSEGNNNLLGAISAMADAGDTSSERVVISLAAIATDERVYMMEEPINDENEWYRIQFQFSILMGGDAVISIAPSALTSTLSRFSKDVQDHKAHKLEYTSWKALIAASHETIPCLYIFKCLNLDSASSEYLIKIKDKFVQVYFNYEMLELLKNTPQVKENDFTMNVPTPSMNVDFGPIKSDAIVMSPYGLAARNVKGNYFTYNPASGQTVDVTGFTFSFKNLIWKVPVAANQIMPGDMIVHNSKILYVSKNDDSQITAVDILDSEVKTVIPITNVFGFNFVTKIVCFINMNATTPDANNPFGNLMPMMMMSSLLNDDESSSFNMEDMGKMMMLSAMMNGSTTNPFANMFNFNGGNK